VPRTLVRLEKYWTRPAATAVLVPALLTLNSYTLTIIADAGRSGEM
jgi:hypothetical protein